MELEQAIVKKLQYDLVWLRRQCVHAISVNVQTGVVTGWLCVRASGLLTP